MQTEQTLEFDDHQSPPFVYGRQDEHLKIIERTLNVRISARGVKVHIQGEPDNVGLAARVLLQLFELVKAGYPVQPRDVDRAIVILGDRPSLDLKNIFLDTIFVSSRKRVITPKGLAQKEYVDAIRNNDIVFGIGPAGTGKTYLAMAMALDALTRKKVRRVILTRPAVEAGERLGFLPGDLMEKVNPYLRPLYDALHDMMDHDKATELVDSGVIEVAPLAFMRGRTLNDSFVILDEAQNTTRSQMKMLLTRLGFDSKAVITGDMTQTDLPNVETSGLREAERILSRVRGISFNYFTQIDVVRHPLVMRIIEAYDQADQARMARRGPGDRDDRDDEDDRRDSRSVRDEEAVEIA